jgi:hypothetical protein
MNPLRPRRASVRAALLSVALGASALAFGHTSHAQVRFGGRIELGAGAMLSDWQRQSLRFDSVGFRGTGRLFVAPIDWLSVQALSEQLAVSRATLERTTSGHVLG